MSAPVQAADPPDTISATERVSVAQSAPSGQLTSMLHAPEFPKGPLSNAVMLSGCNNKLR